MIETVLLLLDVMKSVRDVFPSDSGILLTGGVTADSELVTSVVSLYTADDCDDGVSACRHSGAVYGYHCVIRTTAHIIPIGATSTITTAFKCDIDGVDE